MNSTINKIYLAPMEGVIDAPVRDLLTQINDYDLCITEFLRVVDYKLPKHLFYKIAPELHHSSLTPSGTPVRVQLLGQHPNWMAENAYQAIELGSKGIDINFGCPAPTVNKNQGGAALLKTPETIYQIIKTVKDALSETVEELSVKIRLGFDDTSLFKEIITAINEANPNMLTIHARTKRHGYKPPAYWNYIKEASEKSTLDIIANGEVWDKKSAVDCVHVSGRHKLMLGRGALATPNLANTIKFGDNPYTWNDVCQLLVNYSVITPSKANAFYYPSRIKQWLKYLKLQYPEAITFFEEIKKETNQNIIVSKLQSYIPLNKY